MAVEPRRVFPGAGGDLAWPGVRDAAAEAARHFVPVSLVLALSVLFGVLVSGAGDAYLGSTIPLALLAIAFQGAVFLVFAHAQLPALLLWPVLTAIAYPFVRVPRESALLTFDRLWIVGLLGVLAFTATRLPGTRATRFFYLSFSALVFAYGARAITTAGPVDSALAVWLEALVLPLILFAVTRRLCSTHSRLRSIAAALMLGGLVLALIGIGQRLFGYDLASLSGGAPRYDESIGNVRISGPYPAPEPFALTLVACLAATAFWMQTGKRAAYLVGAAVGVVQVAALALTFFRAAWIAGALVLFAAFALRPPRTLPRFIGVVGIVAALALAASGQLESSSSITARVSNVDNVWGRLATYEKGILIFRSAPLFGVGVEQFREVSRTSAPVFVKGVQSVWDAHSTFVSVLGEQGLVGFLPLIATLVGAWAVARTLRRRARAPSEALFATVITAAGLGYLVMSFTLTMLTYGQSNAFFAVLFGAAAGRVDGLAAGIDTDGR